MSGLEALLQLQCTVMSVDEGTGREPAPEAESTNLENLRGSKAAVYDFWTTRCVNCPAALDRLDAAARQQPSIRFVAVNIDDLPAAKDLAIRAASEGRWLSLTQAHLGEAEKYMAKDILGMKTVPFYVMVGQDGVVLRHGDAKAVQLTPTGSLNSVLVLEGDIENDPAFANASSEGVGHSSSSSAPSHPSLECEGDVCKLVRKKKPEVSEERTAAMGVAPPPPASSAASGTDRPVDCDGGVYNLSHKKAGKSVGVDGITAASKTSEVPAAAVAAAARSIECVGGVCKLVRKQKTPEVERAETKEFQEPLGTGDIMPPLRVVMLEGGETKSLDDVRAGRPAVFDFWTTRCVRCPAALDALEAMATQASDVIYVSLNLDDFEAARETVAQGRWPSVSHAFIGRDEDAGLLEKFKVRAGLKSVPFYVLLAKDGRIDQIGGPKEVKLGEKVNDAAPETSQEAASLAKQAPISAPKAFAFTIDDDF